MRIEACYDSHVHWPAMGEFSSRLDLSALKSAADVKNLNADHAHGRGDWVLGFGWDDHAWSEKPHRSFLDAKFPSVPAVFTRRDAHAVWVNTEALRRAGLWETASKAVDGGRIERDADGRPNGVLIDRAADLISTLIPPPAPLEIRRHLLKGVKTFNDAGFTHIRDMTCDERQWQEALKLDASGLLTLAVEEYFWLKDSAHLNSILDLASRAKSEVSPNLRAKGVKIFLDGALGSEGAWLSRCYHGRDHQGLRLWSDEALREALIKAWEKKLEVAVHAIGDESAHALVKLAEELKTQGHTGGLHIEHAELVRPETAAKIRELGIVCHLQPSHWLSDRQWLKEKLGPLAEHAFPWRQLQELGAEFDFGSDAPIEPASLARTLQALRESAEAGIPRLLGSPSAYMSHRDLAWAPNSYTLLENEAPAQVVFRGEHLL